MGFASGSGFAPFALMKSILLWKESASCVWFRTASFLLPATKESATRRAKSDSRDAMKILRLRLSLLRFIHFLRCGFGHVGCGQCLGCAQGLFPGSANHHRRAGAGQLQS